MDDDETDRCAEGEGGVVSPSCCLFAANTGDVVPTCPCVGMPTRSAWTGGVDQRRFDLPDAMSSS